MELYTRQLWLRRLAQSDYADYKQLVTDPAVIRYCFDKPSTSALDASFSEQIGAWGKGSTGWLSFALIEKSSSAFVGVVGLKLDGEMDCEMDCEMDGEMRGEFDERGAAPMSAELAYMISVKFQRRGFAREAVLRMLQLCQTLGCNSVVARVVEDNIASTKLLTACGFDCIETYSNSVLIEGVLFDDSLFKKRLSPVTA